MYRFLALASSAFLWAASNLAAPPEVGKVLPPWQEGTLDIHQINTGHGNSALFIFPDGTTMLVDAGAIAKRTPGMTPPRPDDSRPPGEWIARYIAMALRGRKEVALDYAIVTHFHGDHMGDLGGFMPQAEGKGYQLCGMTEVGDRVRIRKMLDRGWPDYPYLPDVSRPSLANYRAFLKWQTEHNGMKVERFQPGRNDQVVLQHQREKYPTFELRNIAATGEVWTGLGSVTRHMFPPLDAIPAAERPTENMCSIAFRISYGRFDYYSGGDLPGVPMDGKPQWHDMETPVAKAVGPVEAAVANHHGYFDTQNEFFVSALRPRVWILPSWGASHPAQTVLYRLQNGGAYGPRDIFATEIHQATRVVLAATSKLASLRGHVVLRVEPGGETFRVMILDDTSESLQVKGVFGPYDCR